MTESEILALIQHNIDSHKQGRKLLLESNKIADYQLYPIGTMTEHMKTIKIRIETLESLVSQITAGGSP